MKGTLLLLLSLAVTLTKTTAQNVGIGTTSPVGKLQINQNTATGQAGILIKDSATNAAGMLQFQNINSSKFIRQRAWTYNNISAESYLDFTSDSAFIATMRGNGFVGIGVTQPQARLHIRHNSYPLPTLLLEETEDDFARMEFRNTVANSFWQINAKPNASAGYAGLQIWNSSNGTYTTPLTITGDGRMGIGVTNPETQLEINGQIKIRGGNPGLGKVLTSDPNGFAYWSNPTPKIGFTTYLASPQLFPSSTITKINFTLPTGGQLQLNDGNSFNDATNSFVAPSSGVYHFIASFSFLNPANGPYTAYIYFLVDGNPAKRGGTTNYYQGSILSSEFVVSLSAGSTVSVAGYLAALNQTCNVDNNSLSTSFSGFRVY